MHAFARCLVAVCIRILRMAACLDEYASIHNRITLNAKKVAQMFLHVNIRLDLERGPGECGSSPSLGWGSGGKWCRRGVLLALACLIL